MSPTPLLLLHAAGTDPRMYDALRAELGGDYEIVAPLMGVAPATEALAAIDAPRMIVAGTSFGGHVALQVATAAPERIAGLVLFAASLLEGEPSPELRAYWAEEERLVEGGDLDAGVELSVGMWIREPAVAGLAAEMFRDGYVHDLALEAQGEYVELPVDLAAITAPTIAVSGGLDLPDFAAAADRIVAGVAGARREVVADAGHMIPLERPRAAADIVRSVSRQGSPG
jgi:3-oxoadipate enol-lactonase